jgi:hypothetical protein
MADAERLADLPEGQPLDAEIERDVPPDQHDDAPDEYDD